MSVIHRWLEYLDLMEVRYSHSIHAPARTALVTADAERMPAQQLAKSVVYLGETGFGIAVVPADQFVDLIKLGRSAGLSYIRLAKEAELADLFPDCELGAMPPFGDACEMPVIVDKGLAHDFITFTLGTHRDTIRMGFDDFERLAKPAIDSIAMRQEVHA